MRAPGSTERRAQARAEQRSQAAAERKAQIEAEQRELAGQRALLELGPRKCKTNTDSPPANQSPRGRGRGIIFLGWSLFIIGIGINLALITELQALDEHKYVDPTFSDYLILIPSGLIVSGLGLIAAAVGYLVDRE